MGEEQFLAVDGHAVRDADETDVAAGSGGTQRLEHGLLGADALQDGVGADATGEFLDAGDAFVAAFGDDVGGAELGRELLPRRVAAHRDDACGAQFLGGDDPGQADRPVTDDDHRGAGLDLGGDGRVPACAHDVGQRQQAGDQVVGRLVGGGDQGAVGRRDTDVIGLAGAHELAVHTRGLVAVAAVRTGVVRGGERADDELARLDGGDLAADLLDDADVLVAHRVGLVHGVDTAVVPQVGAADAGGGGADDRVGGPEDLRLGNVLDTDVTGLVDDGCAHGGVSAREGAQGRVRVLTRLPP